jgi:BlaI family penicillinase repressor
MAAHNSTEKRNGRHAILDLAPLELDCLHVLWPMGEATVRDIREALRIDRPRAYTTIMTIMDRMTQKGIVSRRKAGRAWLYAPNVSAGEARERAVQRLVEHFFAGSEDALLAQLSGESVTRPRVASSRSAADTPVPVRAAKRAVAIEDEAPVQARRMDDSLL